MYTMSNESRDKIAAGIRRTRSSQPREHYVYGWYESSDAILPFYIGSGSGNRAWATHTSTNGEKAECEKLRSSATTIKIYRDNLTIEGALLIESVLISVFGKMGAMLTNQCNPTIRKTTAPLEIPEKSAEL